MLLPPYLASIDERGCRHHRHADSFLSFRRFVSQGYKSKPALYVAAQAATPHHLYFHYLFFSRLTPCFFFLPALILSVCCHGAFHYMFFSHTAYTKSKACHFLPPQSRGRIGHVYCFIEKRIFLFAAAGIDIVIYIYMFSRR